MTDFFISYTAVDQPWAEWIDSVLRAADYSTKIQVWDFRPGQNFVTEMHRAAAGSDRTIAVLSPDYLNSLYAMAEWAVAFAADPDGTKGKLVPVLVREVPPETLGLLSTIIQIRLVGLQEAAAREQLLEGLKVRPLRPESVRFPGAHPFPGSAASPPDPEAAEDLLESLPLDEVPQPGGLPVGSRMTLAPNPLFVGREDALRNLARHIRAKETFAVGQIAAASGLGGIGKTQLASEFVHRYGRFFKGGVFWMSFADAAAVDIEVAACGTNLGLLSGFENLPLEQQVRLVQRAWESPLPRLLVFDNCEEEELLRRWRPPFGGSRVLLTSRRSDWEPTLGVVIVQLTTLARQASIELLRRFRPDLRAAEPALDGIANELGDLPLALHLAGSFLRKYSNTSSGEPAAYLQALRETDLLDHPSMKGRGSGPLPTEHDAHVGRTFALSYERLNQSSTTDALAANILAQAAWLAPGEPIPRHLLAKTVLLISGDPTTELDFEDALRRLTDLGLLEFEDRHNLLMHRLIASWSQGVANNHEALEAVEATLLAEAVRLNEAGNPERLLTWQPHLRAVSDRAAIREDKVAARLEDELGLHLWQAGNYSEGRHYLEKATSLHEKISGPEHPDTARSMNILGLILKDQGDYSGAHSYLDASLKIREKSLGMNHRDTANSLNDFGVLLHERGEYEAARRYHERALGIREKILGLNAPDVARSLNNLAALLGDQGAYTEARTYFERALKIRQEVLGPEHPETALSLGNLAGLLNDLGNFEEARSYYEQVLAIQEKALGLEHPFTAKTLNNLAATLQNEGNFRAATTYIEKSLAIREKVLGPDHPETARSLLSLGILYSSLGNLVRARWYLEKAVRIFKAQLGPDHPDTKEAQQRLSRLLRAHRTKKKSGKKKG